MDEKSPLPSVGSVLATFHCKGCVFSAAVKLAEPTKKNCKVLVSLQRLTVFEKSAPKAYLDKIQRNLKKSYNTIFLKALGIPLLKKMHLKRVLNLGAC